MKVTLGDDETTERYFLSSTGEFLSLAAMDTFLRSVQPEVNDLFVLSLVLINLLAWMDLFITQVLQEHLLDRHGSERSLFLKMRWLETKIHRH